MSGVLWPRGTLHVENGAILPAPGELRSPQGSTRVYLLVHGFNNDRTEAAASYRAFRLRIRDLIGLHISQRLREFYWPGYEELIGEPLRRFRVPRLVHSTYTALCYFKQIPKAISFGKMLGDYLLKLHAKTQATEIVMIGHSLGCRLILEAVEQMRPHCPSAKIPAMLLMAGAIPVQHLERAGALRAAVQFPQRRIALYSSRDTVLRWAFPPGQILAGDGGIRPEAMGLTGTPRECWTARDQMMLRHGDYWSHESTTPNIARLFGKTTSQVLPYTELLTRTLAEPPPLSERRLYERQISL